MPGCILTPCDWEENMQFLRRRMEKLQLRPWQFMLAMAGVMALGILVSWGVLWLLPDDWNPAVRWVLAFMPGFGIALWGGLMLPRSASLAVHPDPDPRRSYLLGCALLGCMWVLITAAVMGLLEPLGEHAFTVALLLLVVFMLYRWGLEAADDKINQRAAGDERDAELEHRALSTTFTLTGMVACVLYGLTTFEWFDPSAGLSVMFLVGVMHATREFAFVWYEWRTEG